MLRIILGFYFILLLKSKVCDVSGMSVNRNFKSVPTTVRTFENDTILLPCYHNCEYIFFLFLCFGKSQ